MVTNDPKGNQLRSLVRAPRQVAVATDLRNASVSGGRTRFIGSNSLVIEGSSSTTGTANVSGTQNVTGSTNLNGPVSIAGNQTVTGILNQNGAWNLAGTGGITGAVSSTGPWSQTGTITVSAGGSIVVAGSTPATLGITSLGTPGLQIGSTSLSSVAGAIGMVAGAGSVIAGNSAAVIAVGSRSLTVNATLTRVQGPFDVVGAITGTSKSFKIPHPVKADTWLLHGVTESPVHGVEYWGEEVIGADGSFRVELPDYFEALTLDAGRAVLVTGRGHCPNWSDIDGTHFTVTGEPGKRFSWLVKAARSDVVLVNEEPMELADTGADE